MLAETHEKEALLQDELNKSQNLATRIHQLEMDLQEAAERYREQVHLNSCTVSRHSLILSDRNED
jgi:hypothetical protein